MVTLNIVVGVSFMRMLVRWRNPGLLQQPLGSQRLLSYGSSSSEFYSELGIAGVGNSQAESIFQQTLGNYAMGRTQIKQFYNRFKDSRTRRVVTSYANYVLSLS